MKFASLDYMFDTLNSSDFKNVTEVRSYQPIWKCDCAFLVMIFTITSDVCSLRYFKFRSMRIMATFVC